MSDLFDTHKELNQAECDEYAQNLVNSPVTPVSWQGCHSYTVLSNSEQIIQFRSAESPLDVSMSALAKSIHGSFAPATAYVGQMPDSSVSVWTMEAIAGTGYAMIGIGDSMTDDKLKLAVLDLAQ